MKNGSIPALGYDALTRFCDPLIRWFPRAVGVISADDQTALLLRLATRRRSVRH